MWTLITLCAFLAARGSTCTTNVDFCSMPYTEKYEVFNIVPQIIPVVPDTKLSVINQNYVADFGNDIPPTATLIPALVAWPGPNNGLYTLILFDPDYPQVYLNNGVYYLLRLIVNIPGKNVQAGENIVAYTPPTPLPGVGYSRNVYLLYRQKQPIPVTLDLVISLSTNPGNFSLQKFVDTYDLGNPYAGNFYRNQLTICDPPEQQQQPCLYTEYNKGCTENGNLYQSSCKHK